MTAEDDEPARIFPPDHRLPRPMADDDYRPVYRYKAHLISNRADHIAARERAYQDLFDPYEYRRPNPQQQQPMFYRSLRQELLLRFITAFGRMLAWPIKLIGILLEQVITALSAAIRIALIIVLVPTLLYYGWRFYSQSGESGAQGIGAAAGHAIGDTTKGLVSGVKGSFGPTPMRPYPEQTQAPQQSPPTALDPSQIMTRVAPKIIGDAENMVKHEIETSVPRRRAPEPASPAQEQPDAQPQR